MRCEVRVDGTVVEVLPHGDLLVAGAVLLRAAVLKCLAREPGAVLLDLGGVTGFDDQALSVFPLLVHAAAAWPGIRLIAHSAPPALAVRMRARAVARQLVMVADAAAAREHAAADGGPARVRLVLCDGADDLPLAREAVRAACVHAGWAGIADPAELVAAELVANAVRHAPGPWVLSISRSPHHLHIAVRDHGAEPPVVRTGGDWSTGRGMRIVEALSSSWSSTPTPDGKVVWATIRAPGARLTAAAPRSVPWRH
ncbi:ATP-binding protein [Dactylosporangium aurantiacum]|nr:ATP-binding protein [Dactylosporangium aurantiacum]MDG6105787.1 hypothetical protein [Dactylosporangium aurantiacum]